MQASIVCSKSARAGDKGCAGSSRNKFFQRGRCRQGDAVFGDESPEAAAVTFSAQRAGEQREMNAAAGFVPRAKRAGGDVFPHAFFGAAEEGEFPIVNRAGAIGGEVRDPSALDQRVHDAVRAVFYQMRAVHENDTGVARARRGDFFGAVGDERFDFRRAGRGSFGRVDEDVFDGAEAPALGQRQDFDALQIEWFGKTHAPIKNQNAKKRRLKSA